MGKAIRDYCGCCAPPYDRIVVSMGAEVMYLRKVPERWQSVDKNGRALGKEKP